jgi:DNA-binding LytR/AlgR family response regulator
MTADSALAAIADRAPRLIFLDIWMQGSRLDGLALLDEIKTMHPRPAGGDDLRPRQHRDGRLRHPARRL